MAKQMVVQFTRVHGKGNLLLRVAGAAWLICVVGGQGRRRVSFHAVSVTAAMARP